VILAAFLAPLLIGCSDKSAKQAKEQAEAPAPKTRVVAPPQADPTWGYEEAEGPAKWGTLSPKWAVCGDGKNQSPIEIEKTAKANLPELRAKFRPANLRIIHHEHMADVINTGHSIQVNYTEGDTLSIGDEQFQLLQYHFHSPSEHTVGGKHYPMEMHMVHRSTDGELAVVGVFIEEGAHNAAFEPIWSNLPKSKSLEHHLENVKVDLDSLLPSKTTTYRYDGSLTTPPCSEGVNWIIMTTPIQLSAQQIGAFKGILKGNNRPVQPLYARSVVTDYVAETGTK
jgi:carbonic anhydrase